LISVISIEEHIGSNKLGPLDAASLASAIKDHPSLSFLYLSKQINEVGYNEMRDGGASDIANSIKNHKTVTLLYLSNISKIV